MGTPRHDTRRYKNQPPEQWQIDYIIAHADVRPREIVAEATGLCPATVRRYIGRYCPDKLLRTRTEKSAFMRKEVERLYPTMTVSEIANLLGCTISYVNNVSFRKGLRHNEETQRRIQETWNNNRQRAYDPDVLARRGAAQRRLFKVERLRICSGIPQKTRRHFRELPVRVMRGRNFLIRRGYCLPDPDGDYLTLIINPACKPFPNRINATEQYFAQKYGVKFKHVETVAAEAGSIASPG